MKVCFKCGFQFDADGWSCPRCGKRPALAQGFPSFAGQVSPAEGEGFRVEYFAELASLEAGNFWFRARNRLIVWALRSYFPEARSLLEIGCGTGFVLSRIATDMPSLRLSGSELYASALQFAARRVAGAEFLQMDARRMPFAEEFDVVAAFDVLEHIPEDEDVLAAMFNAVRPGGGIIVTVPQHPALWSRQDEYAHHVRRYSLAGLKDKVESAGFVVARASSFVSLLLPLMAMTRLAKRGPEKTFDPMGELRLPGPVNMVLERVLAFERILIQLGVDLPLGGSLLLMAHKTG